MRQILYPLETEENLKLYQVGKQTDLVRAFRRESTAISMGIR